MLDYIKEAALIWAIGAVGMLVGASVVATPFVVIAAWKCSWWWLALLLLQPILFALLFAIIDNFLY